MEVGIVTITEIIIQISKSIYELILHFVVTYVILLLIFKK